MNVSLMATTQSNNSTAQDIRHQKLIDGAHSFEASFMGELLKNFDSTKGFDGSESGDGDSGGDTMGSYGREALAKAISSAGGLGVAKTVIAQVERQQGWTAAKASHLSA